MTLIAEGAASQTNFGDPRDYNVNLHYGNIVI